MATCRYCGQENVHGAGCRFSPTGMHVEVGDDTVCIFCGSTNYGKGCYNNHGEFEDTPAGLHVHGHGHRKCIWCGKENASGPGCYISPTGFHKL